MSVCTLSDNHMTLPHIKGILALQEQRMAAGLCHECAPGGRSDLGLQAFGTGLVTDTCSTEAYALHEALACHCHM